MAPFEFASFFHVSRVREHFPVNKIVFPLIVMFNSVIGSILFLQEYRVFCDEDLKYRCMET